jgi:urease accessory protein
MNMFASTWFMEGFWHPLQTPSHLILLVALAVLIGQHGWSGILKSTLVFFGALSIGFVLNQFYEPEWNMELLLLIVALNISLLVALRMHILSIIMTLLSIIVAVTLGLDSKPIIIPGFGNGVMYNWLAGALVSMIILLLLVSTLSCLLRNVINGVVLRVIGSWIATSALFVLTLMLVKH